MLPGSSNKKHLEEKKLIRENTKNEIKLKRKEFDGVTPPEKTKKKKMGVRGFTWPQIVDKIMTDCRSTDEGFRDWLLSKKEGNGILFSPLMWLRLYNIQYQVNQHDMDHFIVVTGREGSGKSTFAIQMACALDPNWNLDKLLYEPSQLVNLVKTSKKGDCLILDEGNLFLFSRESMSSDNRLMVKLFALMRQKNLILIINVPNFFTLDSYIRDHRTDTLCYSFRRGQARIYVREAIKVISKEGHRYKRVGGHKVPMTCTFPMYFLKPLPSKVDRDKYVYHKEKNFEQFLKDLEIGISKKVGQAKKEFISITEATNIVSISPNVLRERISDGTLEGSKLGGKYFVKRSSLMRLLEKPKKAQVEDSSLLRAED